MNIVLLHLNHESYVIQTDLHIFPCSYGVSLRGSGVVYIIYIVICFVLLNKVKKISKDSDVNNSINFEAYYNNRLLSLC